MKHPNITPSGRHAVAILALFLLSFVLLLPVTGFAQAPDAIVGRWRWFSDVVMVFNEDGTVSGGPHQGTWKRTTNSTPPTYEIDWDGRFFDTLRLIKGGKELKGKNNKGEVITAERLK